MATSNLPADPAARIREDRAIGRAVRILERRLRTPGPQVCDVADAGALLRLDLAAEDREHFVALFLDGRHCLIASERLFSGSIAGAQVSPRVVLRRALHHNAAAVIVAHNHPSGNRAPSAMDYDLTEALQTALALIDVRLMDHLIVGRGEPFSFARTGFLSRTGGGAAQPEHKPAPTKAKPRQRRAEVAA
ncbi:MAG: hypothetical protein IPO66_06140 [Rhodanobacteraceae bacterium]|nr:hypothetical protein [Rhodanobacteraceae bacterium]